MPWHGLAWLRDWLEPRRRARYDELMAIARSTRQDEKDPTGTLNAIITDFEKCQYSTSKVDATSLAAHLCHANFVADDYDLYQTQDFGALDKSNFDKAKDTVEAQ